MSQGAISGETCGLFETRDQFCNITLKLIMLCHTKT